MQGTHRAQIGLLLFPNLTQLDLTGPFEVFTRVRDADTHLVWKTLDPVRADSGLRLLPSQTLSACPPLDVVCVPGGPGVDALVSDAEILSWLAATAGTARFVVAVCTGSLLLGAAGLLRGRAAACHWASRPMLAYFGATPSDERVVIDGNVVTGGGVTAGIDVALRVVAELAGRRAAETIQLGIEYDPQPPFSAGSPRIADPRLVAQVQQAMRARLAAREEVVRRAASAMAQSPTGPGAAPVA
jgi:cyclohexyl-isocyanide hydratase